ncbi:MAG: GNAT family N-acetyltransferase [Anaerolineales bacterium]|nr:GNAT family N-acetyltransferase [Anaerolineales bacterium]
MAVITSQQAEKIRNLLEQDRAWSAYALADLDPGFIEDTSWYMNNQAVIMTYTGIQPPVLFTHGDAGSLAHLICDLPAGLYQVSIQQEHLKSLQKRLSLDTPVPMQRMVLDRTRFPAGGKPDSAKLLSRAQLSEILELFAQYPDQPDAFVPDQLEQNTFYGLYQDGQLVSFGGTHVVSRTAGIAAVGSIFTHPAQRGKGFASLTTAAVVRRLLDWDIRTIILNVAPENTPAVRCYQRLGFYPVYSYYEGAGTIS